MRCVAARQEFRVLEPDPSALEAVRYLGRRFPDARVREVPLVRAAELDPRADATGSTRIWLALEALQVTGSFQVRGALVALAAAANGDRGKGRYFVAPSVGNHGIAVAYAACVLGLSATVVVPRTSPRTKREKIVRYGAELVVAKTDRYDVAEALAKEIALNQGAVLISPADDVNVALGNGASLGFEIVRGLGRVPDRVLAPFGAGGLATGLAWALAAEGLGCDQRPVWGAQSEAYGSAASASQNGGLAASVGTSEPTLAEELSAGVSEDAYEYARGAIAGIAVVPESQIEAAVVHAYHDFGLVLEGTAAVALAPVLCGLPEPLRGGDLVVVLAGRNIDPDRLDALLARAEA